MLFFESDFFVAYENSDVCGASGIGLGLKDFYIGDSDRVILSVGINLNLGLNW